jgi:hypothetical protein
MTIYENVQRDMIDSYIEDNRNDLEDMVRMENGESGGQDPAELQPYFDEVYSVEHTGKNEYGNDVTLRSTVRKFTVTVMTLWLVLLFLMKIMNKSEKLVVAFQRKWAMEC